NGALFADWRWAEELKRQLAGAHQVRPEGGLASESPDFWVDYVRIAQAHERWAEALQRMNIDVVILDSAGTRPAADLVRESSDWRVVYDAGGALVAERVTP